ncbi:MAG: hydrogenase maturation peptidase HycI [Candidatus Aenigmarchaeota archaeon]|nr:hydrogenase maturation peptidase HycI [Candidatus Aenigmarchaeota archaeon]
MLSGSERCEGSVAVCGIGNSTRGDDACGPYVVEKLKEKGSDKCLHLIDCGLAPENFTGKIKALKPEKIVIVDAVDFGEDAGYFEKIDIEKIKGQLMSTHKLPVSLFIEFLQKEIGCDVEFIGIQPKGLGFCEAMSDECVLGCDKVVEIILDLVDE